MKFYCQDCGKLYQKCACIVYMSAYRFGRTLPEPQRAPKKVTGAKDKLTSTPAFNP